MIREEIQQLYTQLSNRDQFRVSSSPNHTHNGTDSPILDPRYIQNFVTLGSGPGDVISENTIVAPTFSTSFSGPTTIYPIPIVNSGVGGGFNGGNAPEGTMIADGGAANNLNIMIDGTWRSVALS